MVIILVYVNMKKIEYKVLNKCLTAYEVTNLTENSHVSPYGIYGVVKNQVLTGYGVIKNDILYVTWSIGGCTMLNIDKALEFGFIINEL